MSWIKIDPESEELKRVMKDLADHHPDPEFRKVLTKLLETWEVRIHNFKKMGRPN